MQVLRNTSTHAALLLFPDDADVTLGPEGLAAPGLSVPDVSDQTHQLVSAPHPSPGLWWVAGALSYVDGQWGVHNEAMYAKFAPQAEAAWVGALDKMKAAAAAQIDEAVAAIYGRFTRFAIEYQEREAQAQAFKDAGYTGPVPPRVAEFAVPAGMPAQAATDLILSQAVQLRTAQGELSALRMRKYEILRAATDAQAHAVAAEILAGVEAVGRAVQ